MGKRRELFILIMMLFMTLLLSAVLTYVSSRKVAVEIYVAAQHTIARQTAEKFEFALGLGKPIDRFFGASDLISEMVTANPQIKAAWVRTTAGVTMYEYPEYSEQQDEFRIEIQIGNENALVVQLFETEVRELLTQYKERIQIYVVCVFAVGALLMVCLNNTRLGKRATIAVMMLAQLSFGMLVAASYRETYMASIDGTAKAIDRIIQRDIEKIEDFGILRDEFVDFDVYLDEIAKNVGVFEYIGTFSDVSVQTTGDYIKLEESGLYAVPNNKIISDKVLGYVIDALILSAVTLFLALEGLMFLGRPKCKQGERTFSLPTYRFSIFIIYFGINMGAAFTSILSRQLALNSGLSSDFIIGLPISAEMLAGLLAVCASRTILRKMGFSRTMYFGIIIAVCGLLFSALSNNISTYTAARVLVGFGHSILTMSARVIASSLENAKERSDTLAGLISSSIIGYCTGAVIGGLLAERMSFSVVFCVAAVITLLSTLLVGLSGVNTVILQSQQKLGSVLKNIFIKKQPVIYLLALVLPCNAAGMFISYAVPLFGDSFGLTTSVVSALIMANSLIAAYLSTPSSRLVLKLLGSEKAVVFYALLVATVLICFTIAPVPWVLIASAILLGVADSFGLVMMSHNFMEIPAVSKAGSPDAMMTVTLTGKAGQFAAPLLFAMTLGSPLLVGIMTVAGGVIYGTVSIAGKKH